MDLYSLWDTHVRFLKSKTIMLRSLSAIHCSRRSVNFKGKDCVSHMPQCLAGMNEGTWTIPANEELGTFVAPSSSSAQSMVSGRHL